MKLRIAPLLLIMLTVLPATGLAVIPPPKSNPLAGPNKAVRDAQVNLELAKKQVLAIRNKVELQFESKPDWKAAKAAIDKAKADYAAAVKKIADALEKNPDYKALEVKRDKAQAILDQESHPAATPSGDDPVKFTDEQIADATKDRFEAGQAIIEMQKSAEDNDPSLLDLRQKLQDAKATWDALELQVDEAVKLDPAYPAAETNVTQAETQLAQAKQNLAQAAQAERQAVQLFAANAP